MAKYIFTGADLAASATSPNYFQGDRIAQTNYQRTLQKMAVVVLQNTPALADFTWELSAGPQLLASGIGIVGQTTGEEVRNPDDYSDVFMAIPPNTALQLRLTNADAAATHNARVYLLMDRI